MNRPHSSRSPMRLGAIAAALGAASLLNACAPLLIGGALLGGSMVAIDRRTGGTQVDDESIEIKSINRLADAIGSRGHLNVTSYNRLALITGEVPSEADKAAAGQAVGRIENITGVVNELAIGTSSSITDRSNDTVLTSKVKASLVDAKDLQSNAFKVVTERSIVYLMGRVTEREATRAADVARGVSGVRKVIRVFEIVTEAELANGKPAAKL